MELDNRERSYFEKLLAEFPILVQVAQEIERSGGALMLVGGVVRNIVLDLPITDIDVEAHGISLTQLQDILSRHGVVDFVGKSFGVLKLRGYQIDWSIPRKDQSGRKPQVELIPNLSMEEALRRRDVTMNAMAINCVTGEFFDPFGGRADIAALRLRTPDPVLFVEDPLRFYRVMQFIARFGMYPDAELQELCKTIDIASVSKERVAAEFEKMLLKSEAPSKGMRWLRDMNRLHEIMPELAATQGILQDISWHPEGDVFEHTMQAVDAAAQQIYTVPTMGESVIYAALCHDLGKTTTTCLQNGRIRSIGHDAAGVEPARSLMRRIAHSQRLTAIVLKLVRHHMAPGQFATQKAGLPAYKRLAAALAPNVSLRMLALLAYADKRGRNPARTGPLSIALPDIDLFIARATQAGVLDNPEPPLLTGDDIKSLVPPGPPMGRALIRAYEMQIEQGISEKEVLLKRVAAFCRGQKNS